MFHLLSIAAALTSSPTASPPKSAAHATQSPAPSRNAPADEYFGPLKMSALRIRLQIDDLAQHYERRTENDDDIQHQAGDVETAMHAWLAKYPRDVWGPPTAFHLAQLYTDLQTESGRTAARAAFGYVAQAFTATGYGHSARVRLAQGFPELRAEAPLAASPAPGSSTPPAIAASPGPAGATPAAVTGDASPAPANVASPSPPPASSH